MALFWANKDTDPKRRYRFTLNMGDIPVWTVKTANKPKANVSVVEHQYINHTFKYPGRVTWDNISLTLVDPLDPDMAFTMLQKLRKSGYDYPTSANVRGTISKKQSVDDGVEFVKINQINGEGKVIETWELKNPFIVSIDFGGALDYTSDDMNEIAVEIAYDWAEMTKFGKESTGEQ